MPLPVSSVSHLVLLVERRPASLVVLNLDKRSITLAEPIHLELILTLATGIMHWKWFDGHVSSYNRVGPIEEGAFTLQLHADE